MSQFDAPTAGLKPETVREKRIVEPRVLIAEGIKIMQEAMDEMARMPGVLQDGDYPREVVRVAVKFRSGFIICWLAVLALRLENLKSIEVEEKRNLFAMDGQWWLRFARGKMKNKRAYDRLLPLELLPWLQVYLEMIRPILCRGRYAGNCLLVSERGEPLGAQGIRKKIKQVTRERLKVEITPHWFRDWVATAFAMQHPEDGAGAAWALSNSVGVTNIRYNQAGTAPARRAAALRRSAMMAVARRSPELFNDV